MQGDGNLVIYDGSGRPIWASNTSGASGAFLAVLDDGTLAIYRADGNAVLWVAGGGSSPPPPPPPTETAKLGAGDRLVRDGRLSSADGAAILTYQGDGNLVVYLRGAPIWASHTEGRRPGAAVMQGDGNFVISADDGAPVFATNTHGHPGAVLELSNDGALVVRDRGVELWRAR